MKCHDVLSSLLLAYIIVFVFICIDASIGSINTATVLKTTISADTKCKQIMKLVLVS